jgi:hypothetical protein
MPQNCPEVPAGSLAPAGARGHTTLREHLRLEHTGSEEKTSTVSNASSSHGTIHTELAGGESAGLAHGLDCHVLLLTHVRYVVRRGLYGFGSGQVQRHAWNALA